MMLVEKRINAYQTVGTVKGSPYDQGDSHWSAQHPTCELVKLEPCTMKAILQRKNY